MSETKTAKTRILKLRVDKADCEAITEALAIRRSGLFRLPNGELDMLDGESDPKGAALAEICRDWVHDLSRDTIQSVLEKKAAIVEPTDRPIFAVRLEERTNGEPVRPRKPSPDPNKPL